MVENFVVHTTFKIMDSNLLAGKFTIDAEVLNIGNRDVILRLSWLTEYRFSMDPHDRCLRNVNSSQVILYSGRWIPKVLVMEEEPWEDSEMLLFIDASKRYSCNVQCFSAEKAVRLCKHKF